MVLEWLKQNILAAVVGTAVGTAVIGGSVVYLVVLPQAPAPTGPGAFADGAVAAPDRFRVRVSGNLQGGLGSYGKPPIEGTHTFTCDLTVFKEKYCQSGALHPQSGKTLMLQLHAGDPTMFRAESGVSQVSGISWSALRKGVKVFGVTLTAEPMQ